MNFYDFGTAFQPPEKGEELKEAFNDIE